jgi:hypothetical protein
MGGEIDTSFGGLLPGTCSAGCPSGGPSVPVESRGGGIGEARPGIPIGRGGSRGGPNGVKGASGKRTPGGGWRSPLIELEGVGGLSRADETGLSPLCPEVFAGAGPFDG